MKMKLRYVIMISICFVALTVLSSCGNDGDMEISIIDGQYETVVSVSEGDTVESILEKADISLNENDVVSPEADYKIQADDEQISIERCADVTVQVGDESEEVSLTGKTVADALEALDITVGKNDFVNHSMNAYLTSGMTINVQRRYRINFAVDGEEESLLTAAATVEELLSEEGVKTGEDDRVSPKLSSALTNGMDVVVNHLTTEEITVKETIAYSTVYESSSSMYQGSTSVKRAGQNGSKTVKYKVTYVGGVEESREVISETVTKEAVSQIVLRGTKKKASSGKSIVSKEAVYDCDGSGHGYYIITYSDGTVSYQDF